jgi:hypothetical protein
MTTRQLFNILSKCRGDLEVVVGDSFAPIDDVTIEDDCLVLECLTNTTERPASTKFLTQAEEQEG